MDKMCFLFSIPFLDSGTTGLNCSSEIVLPKKHMRAKYYRQTEYEREYAGCTINSRPTLMIHCV